MLGFEVSRELTSAASATTSVSPLTGVTGKLALKASISCFFLAHKCLFLVPVVHFSLGFPGSWQGPCWDWLTSPNNSKPRWHEHKGSWPENNYHKQAGCLEPQGLVTSGKGPSESLLEDATAALLTSPTVTITETDKLQQRSWRCLATLGAVLPMDTAKCPYWLPKEKLTALGTHLKI